MFSINGAKLVTIIMVLGNYCSPLRNWGGHTHYHCWDCATGNTVNTKTLTNIISNPEKVEEKNWPISLTNCTTWITIKGDKNSDAVKVDNSLNMVQLILLLSLFFVPVSFVYVLSFNCLFVSRESILTHWRFVRGVVGRVQVKPNEGDP